MFYTTSKPVSRNLTPHLGGKIHFISQRVLEIITKKERSRLSFLLVYSILFLLALIRKLQVFLKQIGLPIRRMVPATGIRSLIKFRRDRDIVMVGFGRHPSGQNAQKYAERSGGEWLLLEDGFIRSVRLGSEGDITMSLIIDDVGIYYDSTCPSRVENILNSEDDLLSPEDEELAVRAIKLISQHNISKYNHARDVPPDYFPDNDKKRILVVDQTKGDLSIVLGKVENFSFQDMVSAVLEEEPDADIYVKLHPESISGYKGANFDIEDMERMSGGRVKFITEQYNIISIIKAMEKLYVMSSQVGIEGLIMGKDVVCFGAPFYSGWGLTDDRVTIDRRFRKRSFMELFIATYLKYIVYVNLEKEERCDIVTTIENIVKGKFNLFREKVI